MEKIGGMAGSENAIVDPHCTQYGLVSLRKVRTSWPQRTSSAYFANSCTCNLFLSDFLVLISKQNY